MDYDFDTSDMTDKEKRIKHLKNVHEDIGSNIRGVSALGIIILIILLLQLIY